MLLYGPKSKLSNKYSEEYSKLVHIKSNVFSNYALKNIFFTKKNNFERKRKKIVKVKNISQSR